jgi:MOSC domain-containing protein YiiM
MSAERDDPALRPLAERLLDVPQIGRLVWIGVRPGRDAPIEERANVEVIAERGLLGDRASRGRASGKRQVTLVQAEHLPVLASLLARPEVSPALLRRNLAIAGINLLSLVKLRFAIGADVVLVGTGPCAPCAKMDRALGAGAFQAIRGHGGITARVERGGIIRVGDTVRALGAADTNSA